MLTMYVDRQAGFTLEYLSDASVRTFPPPTSSTVLNVNSSELPAVVRIMLRRAVRLVVKEALPNIRDVMAELGDATPTGWDTPDMAWKYAPYVWNSYHTTNIRSEQS